MLPLSSGSERGLTGAGLSSEAMRRVPVIALAVILTLPACAPEKRDVEDEANRAIHEDKIREIKAGMTADRLLREAGPPRSRARDPFGEKWRYGVIQGETPGPLDILFKRTPPKPWAYYEVDVILSGGHVVKIEGVERTPARSKAKR